MFVPDPQAAVTNRIPGLVNWGSFRTCDQILFTENVHKVAALLKPTLAPGVTRALGQAGYLGCEIKWNVPEQTGKGLSLTTFLLKHHTDTSSWHPFQFHGTLLRLHVGLRGYTLRNELWIGNMRIRRSGCSLILAFRFLEVLMPCETLVPARM